MSNIRLKLTGSPGPDDTVDYILDSSNTSFASDINGLGNNKKVFLKESITITVAQEITVDGLEFVRNPDAKIIYAGAGALDYIFKISGDNSNLDLWLEHAGTGTVTSGLVINGDDHVVKEESKFHMNNGSGTLTTGVTLDSGSNGNSVSGIVKAILGTISDADGMTNNSGNSDNWFVLRSY